jgi:hypothetical protein
MTTSLASAGVALLSHRGTVAARKSCYRFLDFFLCRKIYKSKNVCHTVRYLLDAVRYLLDTVRVLWDAVRDTLYVEKFTSPKTCVIP